MNENKPMHRSYFDVKTREMPVELPDSAIVESGEQLDQPPALYVEGYAIVFNTPTVLFSFEGIEYYEQIDGRALDSADMTDVIFNYNHSGKVIARTRNQTLNLTVDSHGLFVRARLDGTDEGRTLYNEIKGGYIDRMSFSYTVNEESYNNENRTFTTLGIKKLYDVSAVAIPAYDDTFISARAADLYGRTKENGIIQAKTELIRAKALIKSKL